MKLSKLNKILSYTSLFLMVYSLFLLTQLNQKWYVENWEVIDYFDTPFYIFAFAHYVFYHNKYTYNARVYCLCVVCYLAFKIVDNHFLFNLQTFYFYNVLILVILPIVLITDSKLDK